MKIVFKSKTGKPIELGNMEFVIRGEVDREESDTDIAAIISELNEIEDEINEFGCCREIELVVTAK